MHTLVKTAKIQIVADTADFLPTIQAYTKAFNFVCQAGYSQKIWNSVELHKITYRSVKDLVPNLASQLICSSRIKAAETIKSVLAVPRKNKTGKKRARKPVSVRCPQSWQQSIRYDDRSYSLFPKSSEVSISTISGRKRFKIIIPDYYRELFDSWQRRSAELVVHRNKPYLNIVFNKEIAETESTGRAIGVDRGISKLAVTSDNKFFGGGSVKKQVRKYQRIRSRLQKRGTKSAKRHLARLSGRERRFMADTNHCIAKQIVNSCNPGDTIVLEDLTDIRESKKRKKQRTMINRWAFYQLEQFILYKALANGISVVFVDPYHTSQTCSKCGLWTKGNRKSQAGFHCQNPNCGFQINADLNASRNVRNKHLAGQSPANGAVVNRPIVVINNSVGNLPETDCRGKTQDAVGPEPQASKLLA